jgi:hypothetical protein
MVIKIIIAKAHDCKDVKKLGNDDIKVPNHQLFDRILADPQLSQLGQENLESFLEQNPFLILLLDAVPNLLNVILGLLLLPILPEPRFSSIAPVLQGSSYFLDLLLSILVDALFI